MEIQPITTISDISETRDEHYEITIEISPTSTRKDIEKIMGKFGKHSCQLNKDELDKLVQHIKGMKGSLSDKINFHVKGSVNPKGQFQLFVTGLATTAVQFKLWGKVFPNEPIASWPFMMDNKIFKQLGKYKTDNLLLKNWISKMIGFWNGYSHMFDNENEDLKVEVRELRNQVLEMRREIGALRKEINILQCHNIKL